MKGDRWSETSHDVLPCVDPVERLEQQGPQEQCLNTRGGIRVRQPDQILAYPVRGAEGVREPVRRQYRVVRPGADLTAQPPQVDALALGCEPPENRIELRRAGWERLLTVVTPGPLFGVSKGLTRTKDVGVRTDILRPTWHGAQSETGRTEHQAEWVAGRP